MRVFIDGREVEGEGTILDVSLKAGIYIPTLCYHPDLESLGACGLCVVELGKEIVPACTTKVEEGMDIKTSSPNLKEIRRDKLATILESHPHACLLCSEREGCAREPCSLNVPVEERCCDKFGNCEVQRIAEYIGIKEDTPRYKPRGLSLIKDKFIVRNYNLCIGCGRCVRACPFNLLGEPKSFLNPLSQEVKECRFCGVCIEVCPTGSLMDKEKIEHVPCEEECPCHVRIPAFLRQVSEERFSHALSIIYEKNPLPGVTSLVCNAFCESKCRRAELDEPVSIKSLKHLVFEKGEISIQKKAPTGKRVAVIGSGPAGLSCAFYLANFGHSVRVFEARENPGGMLTYIPSFRLPREVLHKEISIIKKAGVEIETKRSISSLKELEGYDAIFVGIGAQKSKKLNIEGESDERVIYALPFLSSKERIGKRVAVVGGGNTAIDSARKALRQGAEVTIFYRRREEDMPANKGEVEEAKREGLNFRFQCIPKAIYPLKKGIKIEFVEKEKSFFREFDNLIIAIGQEVIPIEGIQMENGLLKCDDTLCAKKGVYVGGDAIGISSVANAIAQGREAAFQINSYLGYKEEEEGEKKPSPLICNYEDFLNPSSTIAEARRCCQCDLRLYLSKVSPPPVVELLTAKDIDKVPEKPGVYTLYNQEGVILEIKGVPNLRRALQKLEKEIELFKYEEDPMYSKRESELIQLYVQRYGKMPGEEDLF
jgi:NADPH-dependent glutamate synthase beta subunit-like oxidoreductase